MYCPKCGSQLPARALTDKDDVLLEIHGLMDRGLLHRHLQENSTLEEMNLTFVPYWIVSVSARTSIVASDMAMEAGQIATTATLAGVMGSAFGGGRRGGGFGGPLLARAMMGTMMGPRNSAVKTYQMDNNYNFRARRYRTALRANLVCPIRLQSKKNSHGHRRKLKKRDEQHRPLKS